MMPGMTNSSDHRKTKMLVSIQYRISRRINEKPPKMSENEEVPFVVFSEKTVRPTPSIRYMNMSARVSSTATGLVR